MTLVLAAFLLARPAPLDMPRAEAWLVRGTDGVSRLEDRYDAFDLWTSRSVLGRWEDDDGRLFTVARLDVLPPSGGDLPATRTAAASRRVTVSKKETDLRDRAVARLSPGAPAGAPVPPHLPVRGIEETLYYPMTNTTALVCAFLPEESPAWYLAVWELLPGDDPEAARTEFEEGFLVRWRELVASDLRSELAAPAPRAGRRRAAPPTERELLRADARHSVTNYASWHVTDGETFSILDNLPDASTSVVAAFTNDLSRLLPRFAAAFPSPLDGSNVLSVARIYRDRDEYLDAVGEEMKWSAACWSQSRRELVAHLPAGGRDELLKTLRHESFHQYLSYAAAMITVSPWLNEGYAQYFEDVDDDDWGLGEIPDEGRLAAFASLIPALLQMDYERFYAGTDAERRLKYRLAWSVARFLERGAPEILKTPFADLKRDYLSALLKTRDMSLATAAAFGSVERVELFVEEWLKYWKAPK